jgi:hypothetical protein
MIVYVLLREDQNEHGYIDTSIAGVFLDERRAKVARHSIVCMPAGRDSWWRTTRVLTASGRCPGRSRSTS